MPPDVPQQDLEISHLGTNGVLSLNRIVDAKIYPVNLYRNHLIQIWIARHILMTILLIRNIHRTILILS